MNRSFSSSKVRYESLDALRGLSLMGIFLVHMVEYYAMAHLKPEESVTHDIIYFLFSGKAFSAFAFLFGVSFYIIIDGQRRRNIDFRKRFCWRLCILLTFGWLHGLVYFGDVLTSLAIFGLLIVPFYFAKTRLVLIGGAIFLFQLPTLLYLISSFIFKFELQGPDFGGNDISSAYEAFTNGSFIDVVNVNLWKTQFGVWMFNFQACRGSVILGMMLLGLAFGQSNTIKNLAENTKRLFTWCILACILGILCYIIQIFIQNNAIDDGFGQFYLHTSIVSIKKVAFTIFGISGFFLLYKYKIFQKLTSYLKPAGRMSLTLYISQSIIAVPIFYGYGLGAYAYIGQTNAFLLGIGLWVSQMIFAKLWLKNFQYGPLEGIWRKLTYLKFQP